MFKGTEMQGPGSPSFEQLRVFLTVVETGSFAAAGRRLRRATSAVSQAIASLELQLGVTLFDRRSTRKPTLTEAGTAVLSEARSISVEVDRLKATVNRLTGGLESEVALAVDVMMPTARLVEILRAFESEFPTVALRLYTEALGAVTQLVLSGVAHIGVGPSSLADVPGIEHIEVGSVEFIPVAAPDHPLAVSPANAPGDARRHLQLVLTDRSPLSSGREYGVLGLRTWRLADLGSKHALLRAGIGWGNMPEPLVRADLEAGRLKRLDIPEWSNRVYRFEAIHRTDTPPRPAAAWLISKFAE